ncbi:Uncharacterised protein [Vibrio cholerae]|nr:Uncharacterised protein [Vibrio cholerae]
MTGLTKKANCIKSPISWIKSLNLVEITAQK